ncbi:DUF433 domain-containing protein [Nitrospirillum amazonense]|uniref:DUF433 domain-containing protein n=1 Tax=Nitrospirillum amazonense TaxID=28077 RepID=UPI0024128631|nr:DUF433 domain-containing protein [Nitrospirillum amazonense]MDG3440067.1 DUF433 domain-containing protein [Nitrospirillum amazonense]
MGVMLQEPKPLIGGFYTIQEASRILGLDSQQRIRGWLSGYAGRAEPIICRQYPPVGDSQEVGFWDLLEIRFIEHFRKQGVSLQSIRKAAHAARVELHSQHPFAMSSIRFMTDRKRIFLHFAEKTGDKKLLDLMHGQFTMYEIIEQALARGIEFSPSTGLAQRWHPKPIEFPNVVLDPLIAFGQPVIDNARIPTSALFSSWKAEGNDYSIVADWYEIDEALVRQAVEFETVLPA